MAFIWRDGPEPPPTPTVAFVWRNEPVGPPPVDPADLAHFRSMRLALPNVLRRDTIRLNAVLGEPEGDTTIVLSTRALAAAQTVPTFDGDMPQLTHHPSGISVQIHHDAHGTTFCWGRPTDGQILVGDPISGRNHGDLRIHISTSAATPAIPLHLAWVARASTLLPRTRIHNKHSPHFITGTAIAEIVFVTALTHPQQPPHSLKPARSPHQTTPLHPNRPRTELPPPRQPRQPRRHTRPTRNPPQTTAAAAAAVSSPHPA